MLRFNYTYALLSLFLFTLEVIIERFFHGGFIRNVFGDYLVVFLIYCFVLSFFKWKKLYVAIGVLVLAYLIEIAQYIDILQLLKIKKSQASHIVLGSSFDWKDMAAYTLAFFTILGLEKLRRKKQKN